MGGGIRYAETQETLGIVLIIAPHIIFSPPHPLSLIKQTNKYKNNSDRLSFDNRSLLYSALQRGIFLLIKTFFTHPLLTTLGYG